MYILHHFDLDLTDDYDNRVKGKRKISKKSKVKKEEVFREMPLQPRTLGYRKK